MGSIDTRHLYDDCMPMLFRIAVRIVQSPEAAEDIVQDAFAKFVEKSIPFQNPEEAKYWLIRVVKNNAINHAKRRVRESKAYEKWWRGETTGDSTSPGRTQDPEGLFVGVTPGTDAEYLDRETAGELKAALAELPERLRTVLILKEYGGLSYREIGKVMRISEGNVKVRAFRAREALLDLLRERK